MGSSKPIKLRDYTVRTHRCLEFSIHPWNPKILEKLAKKNTLIENLLKLIKAMDTERMQALKISS